MAKIKTDFLTLYNSRPFQSTAYLKCATFNSSSLSAKARGGGQRKLKSQLVTTEVAPPPPPPNTTDKSDTGVVNYTACPSLRSYVHNLLFLFCCC